MMLGTPPVRPEPASRHFRLAEEAEAERRRLAEEAEAERRRLAGLVTEATTAFYDAEGDVDSAEGFGARATALGLVATAAKNLETAIMNQAEADRNGALLMRAQNTYTAAMNAQTATQAVQDAMDEYAALSVPDGVLESRLDALMEVAEAAQAVLDAINAEHVRATDAERAAASKTDEDADMAVDHASTEIAKAVAGALMKGATDNADAATGTPPFHGTADMSEHYVIAEAYGDEATVTVTDPTTKRETSATDKLPLTETDPPAIDGWTGFIFERESTDGSNQPTHESLTVYTDIHAPVRVPFIDRHGANMEPAADDTGHDALVNNATPTEIYRRNFLTENLALVRSNGNEFLATGANSQKTFTDGAEVPGTFEGAAGRYQCTAGDGNGCTVGFTADGGPPTAMADTWIFIPTTNASAIVTDVDYLTFAYWLEGTEEDGGDTRSYDFQAHSQGSEVFGSDAFVETDDEAARMTKIAARMTEVEGSASYTGAAGGMYMRKVVGSDGKTIESATHGRFTADVALDADFGGSDVASNDQFSISGMVSGFEDGDGNALGGWSVTLERADFVGRNPTTNAITADSHANAFMGETEGDSAADAGQWTGMFYGSSAPADLDGDRTIVGTEIPQPTGVAGEFNAHFTNGHVHGGFGATETEE